jgi:hypothetical protein
MSRPTTIVFSAQVHWPVVSHFQYPSVEMKQEETENQITELHELHLLNGRRKYIRVR